MTLLAVKGLSKAFPGVRALDGVDFDLCAGEVHALLGENGAGKSTLVKILAGAVVPDAGTVTLDGAPLPFGDPLEAQRHGVSIVYQELTLVPELSVAENIFLGRERGWPFLRRREMSDAARVLLAELGSTISPEAKVRTLSVAQQQMVEIARALAADSKILVLDEPSAMLSDPEVESLFAALRRPCARGLGVVYISHRLEEIFSVANRVTVLRDGCRVAVADVEGVERAELIRWMVGREVSDAFPPRTRASVQDSETPVLEAQSLSCPGHFEDVCFDVHRGEIVGLAGLVGAGRTAVALALFGALGAQSVSGAVRVLGRAVRFSSPADAIDAGLGYVTEDRKGRGVFPLLDVGANITIAYLRTFARALLLSPAREDTAAAGAVRDFDVRAATLRQPAATLSGGNQQKLLLARYLLRPRTLLILDEPTRGIDIGAKAEIYALMNRLTAAGLGILMISSELPEILGMSDRIVVMHEGRVAGELTREAATPELVMHLATGAAA